MTINGTNTFRIYLILFSIHLQDYGTHFLRLVDVLLHWVRFVLIWRHISGQSYFCHSFCHIYNPAWFLTYLPTTDNGFDYPNDLCIQNAQFRRLDATEILHIRLELFSHYKSNTIFKGLVGMAPHGAITFNIKIILL